MLLLIGVVVVQPIVPPLDALQTAAARAIGRAYSAPAPAGSPPDLLQPSQKRLTRGILEECAKYAVPPPPPLSPETAAAAAPAIALIKQLGTLGAYTTNATFAALMDSLSKAERERIAYESHAVMLNLGDEIPQLMAAEEAAALAAAPLEDLSLLNGLNVGAGGRPVDPTLLLVDAHRGFGSSGQVGWFGSACGCMHGLVWLRMRYSMRGFRSACFCSLHARMQRWGSHNHTSTPHVTNAPRRPFQTTRRPPLTRSWPGPTTSPSSPIRSITSSACTTWSTCQTRWPSCCTTCPS